MLSLVLPTQHETTMKVGSKGFTESVILGEIITQVATSQQLNVQHRGRLGGTGVTWQALLAGQLDAYPDYSGTIAESILGDPTLTNIATIREQLATRGIGVTDSLGFENSYAIGMRRSRAEALGISKISDLANHPELKLAFGAEFMTRQDCWQTLKLRYRFPQAEPERLDHGLAFVAIERGDIDVMDLYTTDSLILKHDLVALEDDLNHFPKYEAVVLYRTELETTAPDFVTAIKQLEGTIDQKQMILLNQQRDLEGTPETIIANHFVFDRLGLGERIAERTARAKWLAQGQRLLVLTWEHALLVTTSLGAAILIAIPLGILAAKRRNLQQIILSAAEIIQTIPGLALLILLMTPVTWLGFSSIGAAPAIVALFLYSLLPIMRNTYAGIQDIPNSLQESAAALGLTRWAVLRQIELPLASRTIFAGIKTTAVINVGYATLGGLIGAGGYGELIAEGMDTVNMWTMVQGAVPAALLALLVKWGFEFAERFIVPTGLQASAA
ncbi:MAG: amino acid ABC transporter permease [Blastopirellula sp.]|nr:amino acid ABC transporter permease [Blastopirellula sp.]